VRRWVILSRGSFPMIRVLALDFITTPFSAQNNAARILLGMNFGSLKKELRDFKNF